METQTIDLRLHRQPFVAPVIRAAFLVTLAAALLASCATPPEPLKSDAVHSITAAINGGDAARLVSMSASSFAFDGEVLDRAEDIAALWNGLVKAGLHVGTGAIPDAAVTADSYRQFANGAMTKWFFSRHVPARARIITLTTNLGRFLLVAGTGKTPEPVIYGIAGPIGTAGGKG
ncbi:MAG TPA: hypothetical protein VMW87_15195 [Spirochaetia bacterium]|nr:hypothetical protein [Spirochaetia bacterium]